MAFSLWRLYHHHAVQSSRALLKGSILSYNIPQEYSHTARTDPTCFEICQDKSILRIHVLPGAHSTAWILQSRLQPACVGATRPRGASPGASSGRGGAASDLEAEAGFWQCASCTYANHDLAADACEVCETPRPGR